MPIKMVRNGRNGPATLKIGPKRSLKWPKRAEMVRNGPKIGQKL